MSKNWGEGGVKLDRVVWGLVKDSLFLLLKDPVGSRADDGYYISGMCVMVCGYA